MVALQIRDVPDDVRDRLAESARARGQSLQAYLLALVTDEARRADNRAILEAMARRDDGSRLTPADLAQEARRVRDERDEHLMRLIGPEAETR